jgi:hypothetical protein
MAVTGKVEDFGLGMLSEDCVAVIIGKMSLFFT